MCFKQINAYTRVTRSHPRTTGGTIITTRWVDVSKGGATNTNYRSRNALEAIGAQRTTRYELEKYQGKRVIHLVYEIDREAFTGGPLG